MALYPLAVVDLSYESGRRENMSRKDWAMNVISDPYNRSTLDIERKDNLVED